MVNGVPREVPWPRTSQGTPFTMRHPRLFHRFSLFSHPGLVYGIFFQPMDSLGSIMVNIFPWLLQILIVLNLIY